MSKNNILPIQFIGTQRSGSNLLRVILNQFNEISAPHPPHILKSFFPILRYYGDLNSKENFKKLVTDVCEWVNLNPVPWDITLDPARIYNKCTHPSLVEILRVIYHEKARKDNARYWCCKSMESVYYYKEIEKEKIFPIYIFIFRDGRDVALSFTKTLVGPKHIYFLAQKWKQEQELAFELKSVVPPNRFITVRYEDLIHSPETSIKHICSQLNIQYSSVALDYFHSSESIIAARSGPMWSNLIHPIITGNHDKFKTEFSNEQLLTFERVAGAMLNKLGYTTLFTSSKVNEKFSNDELDRFKIEEEFFKQKAIEEADPVELSRRRPQENLYDRIVNRKAIAI